MAILARILQFFLWLMVATWLVRKLLGWLSGGTAGSRRVDVLPAAPKPLQRCAWCGTFVSPEISHTLQEKDLQYDFCSVECRQRFLEARRVSARPGQIGASA